MRKITGIALIIISIVMIYISVAYKMIPPGLTGIGFIMIALNFMVRKEDT